MHAPVIRALRWLLDAEHGWHASPCMVKPSSHTVHSTPA
jgi:hypothetical protein